MPDTGAIPGGYLDNHMSDCCGTNTSVMRIVHTGEWNVVWGSAHDTCNLNSTSENDMPIFNIFHDLCWYSETLGHEGMKQTSFIEKYTVFMINIYWNHYNMHLVIKAGLENQNSVV